MVMRFESRVTAPFKARALPSSIVAPVPSVAELPTCQKTLFPGVAPELIVRTKASLAVVSVDPIWKMNCAFESPMSSSVRVPVNSADDPKR